MTLARLYAMGRLSPEDREAFEIHLLECPACRARVAEAEKREIPVSALLRVLGRLEQERQAEPEPVREGSAVVDVLVDLCAGHEPLLFHALVCDACREQATAALLARHGVGVVLPVGALGELLCGGRAEAVRELAAEGLLEELLRQPRERRFDLLEEPRFQNASLVEVLLAASGERQLREPQVSADLAFLANRLAFLVLDVVEQVRAATRAAALLANAHRLAGRPEEAERAAAGAAPFSVPRADRARLFRVLGLVYWELGRPSEGAGFLEDAVRLFSELQHAAAEGESLLLLGLLSWEEGWVPQCIGSLLAGLPLLGADRRPWLAARGCLTAAAAFAETGCTDEARDLLRKGREHTAAVQDREEAAFLYFLEGTVLGRLGEGEPALSLLEPARRLFLTSARLPEAALASLEVAAVLAAMDRAEETEDLADELEDAFRGASAAEEALAALRRTPWDEPRGLRQAVDSEVMVLRRLFRMDRLQLRPIPFA